MFPIVVSQSVSESSVLVHWGFPIYDVVLSMCLMMLAPGVWCEDIVLGPELQLRREDDADHLMLAFDTKRNSLTIYFSCIGKGQVQMPVSLKELQHRMKHSKVGEVRLKRKIPTVFFNR